MKTTTVNILQNIKNGNFHTLTKSDDNEVFIILKALENFQILSKNKYGGFIVNGFTNISKIDKLIEIDDLNNFIEYLKQQSDDNIINLNFKDVQIGQFNSHSAITNSSNVTEFNKAKDNTSSTNIFLKIWNFLSKNPLISTIISGLVIAMIFYMIKHYYGVDLK